VTTSRICCAALALVLLAGCNTTLVGPRESDWERGALETKEAVVREQQVVLPPYPRESDLVEFGVGPTRSHRYFIDASSLQMGADGVARYALVVRTAGGASNTSYEGIRCKGYEKRIYALGRAEARWIEAKRSSWEKIDPVRTEYQAVLYRDYLCPDRTLATREDALRALRYGPASPILR